jgi:hypothetical protein
MAKPQVLTIFLVGRICLVTTDERTCAVFLDARHDPSLKLRKHQPLLNAELRRVDEQLAKQAKLTIAGNCDATASDLSNYNAHAFGVWALSGFEINITGVSQKPDRNNQKELAKIANLNQIVESVAPGASFDGGILAKDPSGSAVVARLELPASASISAVTSPAGAKLAKRTFSPGSVVQRLAQFVKCEMEYEKPGNAPGLLLRHFNKEEAIPYGFQDLEEPGLTLVMSNLCNCADTEFDRDGADIDPEFVIYYQLLKKQLPAASQPKPTFIPAPGANRGGEVAACQNATKRLI